MLIGFLAKIAIVWTIGIVALVVRPRTHPARLDRPSGGWPLPLQVTTRDEGLGEKLASATKAGPTRPHPHTPPSPAVLKAAGPAVAAADKLRDAASGRDN